MNGHNRGRGAFYSLLIIVFFSPILTHLWFGLEFAVVASSSMEPAISAGDLEVTALASVIDLKIGDVILLNESNSSNIYSHRVTNVKHQLTGVLIQTRGDANTSQDATIAAIPIESKVPRTVYVIPKVGYVISFLSSESGRLIVGLLLATSSGILIFQKISQDKIEKEKTNEFQVS
jgi:signal peptidase I